MIFPCRALTWTQHSFIKINRSWHFAAGCCAILRFKKIVRKKKCTCFYLKKYKFTRKRNIRKKRIICQKLAKDTVE